MDNLETRRLNSQTFRSLIAIPIQVRAIIRTSILDAVLRSATIGPTSLILPRNTRPLLVRKPSGTTVNGYGRKSRTVKDPLFRLLNDYKSAPQKARISHLPVAAA